MSTPIRDLGRLLREMSPVLVPGEFVFSTVPPGDESSVLVHRPKGTFWEDEGLSVVIARADADRLGLSYDSVHRCITLQVHSSLTAVGLTAAVSTALAAAGVSANVVAAHHHDHVFVPTECVDAALQTLLVLGRS